jgi:flavin reductase (DIM6/NTAB) family NADH-FMN oxidoreductase RutF
MSKVELDTDKWSWHPSPLVGQVVLVTTVDSDGNENVAPKSWVSMFAFDPPILGVGCNLEHMTARNILETLEFTVNIPRHTQADKTWRIAEYPHPRRLKTFGFTPLPGVKVKPPRIAECSAHLECVFDSCKAWEREVAIFGRIVSYSRDSDVGKTWEDWYRNLGLFLHLEENIYGVVGVHSLAHVKMD